MDGYERCNWKEIYPCLTTHSGRLAVSQLDINVNRSLSLSLSLSLSCTVLSTATNHKPGPVTKVDFSRMPCSNLKKRPVI
jgi:hypothetical protein